MTAISTNAAAIALRPIWWPRMNRPAVCANQGTSCSAQMKATRVPMAMAQVAAKAGPQRVYRPAPGPAPRRWRTLVSVDLRTRHPEFAERAERPIADAIRQVAGASGDQQRRIEAALEVLGDELLDRSPGPPSARPAGRRRAEGLPRSR